MSRYDEVYACSVLLLARQPARESPILGRTGRPGPRNAPLPGYRPNRPDVPGGTGGRSRLRRPGRRRRVLPVLRAISPLRLAGAASSDSPPLSGPFRLVGSGLVEMRFQTLLALLPEREVLLVIDRPNSSDLPSGCSSSDAKTSWLRTCLCSKPTARRPDRPP